MDKKESLNSWIEIDKKAFAFNLKQVKRFLSKETKIMAVVKSDAYGHDAKALSKEAVNSGADALAVSNIYEGADLRKAGIKVPILILGRIFPHDNLKEAVHYNLMPTLSDMADICALESLAKILKKTLSFHLAIDTGMGRIGLLAQDAFELIDKISKSSNIKMEGIYTHFSAADTDSKWTKNQLNLFNKAVSYARSLGLNFLAHCSNSPAIFKYKEAKFDMVRPGICLYGIEPFKGYEKKVNLKPVLTWKTKIVFIKKVPAGFAVSYGKTFITKKPSVIAVLPIGYSDGYNRLLSNKASVLIRGEKCPIIGRVTMNMTIVDITKVKGAVLGSEVVLIGSQGKNFIKAEDLAKITGTIAYETVCAISPKILRIIV